MVTMRRDVAAAASNSIFDRVDRDVELTDYDIFMRNRERSVSASYASEPASYTAASYPATATLGYRKTQEEEPKASSAYADYDEYMRAQIHRSSAGKLLSKEEFYQEKFEGERTSKPASAKRKGRMTKAGKIFTAVYVLMVVIAASIIIAVNTASDGGNKVSASADAYTGEIQALTVESSEIEGNWFDDILDGISNK